MCETVYAIDSKWQDILSWVSVCALCMYININININKLYIVKMLTDCFLDIYAINFERLKRYGVVVSQTHALFGAGIAHN